MEMKNQSKVDLLEGFHIINYCKICKKPNNEVNEGICYAYNMKLKYGANACSKCLVYRAAKLEYFIMHMAAELGLEVRQGRRACATLMDKPYLKKSEVLTDKLKKRLNEIPPTFHGSFKACPFSCDHCSALEEVDERGFEFVNQSEMDKDALDPEILRDNLSGNFIER